MKLAVVLILACAATAFAQNKVAQRRASSDCTGESFTANGVRVCTLSDALSATPLVFVNGHLEQLDLRSAPDDMPGWGWVGLVASKRTGLWVGVLDWQVESSGEDLVLLVTTDKGKSWTRLPAVKKPHYLATFRSLELVTARRWLLTITLDDCADCGVKLGKRVFETTDAGEHWTAR